MKFEEAIEVLEQEQNHYSIQDAYQVHEAIELAADALAFAAALHEMFHTSGVISSEEDLNKLQSVIDGHLGELAAASIFLSNLSTMDTPKALMGVHASLTQEGGNIPSFVVDGYARLATRIRALKAVREVREINKIQAPPFLTGED